ncbi:group-specific protein [Brevibacillus brevis]|uniref:group-specific protein n=1 Tax=Brevibacillus brevis TaxID=1393 RepID=UPI000D1025C0|nr:group-specific protein [Brevibacillus brevis]PSJ67193.1 group-specific protein [Brevibacillus brevis]RED25762.1 hypothetical protein DES34_112202 [Brevibacillus brevis]GEC93640.1 hypothetical protein BBR01nite_59710 [Brevibacillus brevis]VEF87228.1 Domain of uncharacterised function (DUF771) [Brevibacillus brevis]
MKKLVAVDVDEQEIRNMCREKISELIKEADAELVFWDKKELLRRTMMCWPTILNQFFYDPRFPKHKIGTKWYFPARETREFLTQWLSEQPKH